MKSGARKKALIGILVLLFTAACALIAVFAVRYGKPEADFGNIAEVSAAMPDAVKPTQQSVCGLTNADGTDCGKICYSINTPEELAYVVTESMMMGGGGRRSRI